MEKTAILYEASRAVLSTFDLDEVLQRILTIVRDHFEANNIAILLLDADKNELLVRSHVGRINCPTAPLAYSSGIAGQAAATKRPVYAPNVAHDPRYVKTFPRTRSQLAIPLVVRDQVVGVLDVHSEHLNGFAAETMDLLTLFSAQAAIAIENARLYSLERRRASQLEAINEIAKQTAALFDLEQLLETVCGLLLKRFHVDYVGILLLEDDKLNVRAQQGNLTLCAPKGMLLIKGQGLSSIALEKERTVVENNVASAEAYVQACQETKAEMCVPLIAHGDKLGVLVLDSARVGSFQEEDIPALEAVGEICAGAIRNAQIFARTRQLAHLDGLTGIFNRRVFELRIAEELVRAERYHSNLTVIMLDIDHFKRLNDELGHLVGDDVLRQVSQILQRQLRKGDVMCRYGGEEFAILATNTSIERGRQVAEKLRRSVEQWLFPGVPRAVTVSAGISEYPKHGNSRDQIVSAADNALYAAKQAGRNLVATADGIYPIPGNNS